jgi:glycosyltransferase involved in cell wall biosynthesis
MADFVATDVELLSRNFDVRTVFYRGTLRGIPDAFRILVAVASTSASVSWFGYTQAYFAVTFSRILGKPSVVILGGFDVSSEEWPDGKIPDKQKGRLESILKNGTVLLPISKRIASLAQRFTSRTDLKVIPLGFNPDEFAPSGTKDRSVVTTAYIRRDYLDRKGLRDFVLAARRLESTQFYIVGKALDESVSELRRTAGPNTILTGWLAREDLIDKLRRASVYVQASLHEGFGSALAQAMLCECVPVVTDRGAIPEVVGEAGIYVEAGNPQSLAEGIMQALEKPELGKLARTRIIQNFNLNRRRADLLATIESVLQ